MSETRFATPQEAEEAFYDAFQRADLAAMMEVWAEDDGIVCVHPLGPSLRGRDEVRESWRQIFAGGEPMRFEISDASRTQDTWLSVHCVHENIAFGPRLEHRSRMMATNVYQLTRAGWRIIVHHASPEQGEDTEDAVTTPDEEGEPPPRLH